MSARKRRSHSSKVAHTDIEDRENGIVVIALQSKIFLEPSQACIACNGQRPSTTQLSRRTDICSVDEAEQVQDRHSRNDVQINLETQPRFSLLVEGQKRVSKLVGRSMSALSSGVKSLIMKDSLVRLGELLMCRRTIILFRDGRHGLWVSQQENWGRSKP